MTKVHERTLTEFEVIGLESPINLADGHADQEMPAATKTIVHAMPELFYGTEVWSSSKVAGRFKAEFASLINSTALDRINHFQICPTASNSIEVVAAYLSTKKMRAALIEPTFDNIALLMRRRGVHLVSIEEGELAGAAEANSLNPVLKRNLIDALVVVQPNNPTGQTLSEDQFRNIISFCVRESITLICDNSFRLFASSPFDDYALLDDSGVSFICFEDTGKVFPTHEMKASLLVYSPDNKQLIEEIYREVYLRDSPFKLAFLTQLFKNASGMGLRAFLQDDVDERRQMLRRTIAGTGIRVAESARDSTLSVEWLDCRSTGKTDNETHTDLRTRGLIVLPGHGFFWNSSSQPDHQFNLRVSLLKQRRVFERGIAVLAEYCASTPAHEELLAGLPRLGMS